MCFLTPSNYPNHGNLWFFKKLGLLAGSAVQLEECLPSMYKILGLVLCPASNWEWDYCVVLEVDGRVSDVRAQGWK